MSETSPILPVRRQGTPVLASSIQLQPLLTSREAAEFLKISERTLWQLANDGEVKRVVIKKAVRYDLWDLLDYIESVKR